MKKNILVLTYFSYRDALIQTYTLPYVRLIIKALPAGSRVTLLTLEKDDDKMNKTETRQISNNLRKDHIDWISATYRPFGLMGFWMWLILFFRLIAIVVRNKIEVIHCWAVTAGSMGSLIAMVTGRKLVIDSYEPHAEAMVENGTWARTSLAFRILFYLEKLQSRRAAYVISATAGMKSYAKEKYGVDLRNFVVKPACVDLNLFSVADLKDKTLLKELSLENKLVCVYAGKLGGIYLAQEVFDFFRVAYDFFGDRFRVLLLTNQPASEIEVYCKNSGLPFSTIKQRFVPHDKIPRFMGLGDFAITPVKPVPTKRYCTPIKDGEYWALGLPVVITANISDDSEIIEANQTGAVLSGLNTEAYQDALIKIAGILSVSREGNFKKIRHLAETHRSFAIAEEVYQSLYGKGF